MQIGQLANHLDEKDKEKFLIQPEPNLKVFAIGNSSSLAHEQEHVQAIVILRLGRQVNNHVVEPEVEPAGQEGQEGEESGNKEERDVEPSTATPIMKDPLWSFVLRCPILKDYKRPRKEESLRTFWMCSSKSKLIFRFWTPSSKYLHMPSS